MSKFSKLLESDKSILLNDEQLSVVYSDVNSVVSAGAGSGKTTVLSYRFLRLILDKNVKVDEILTLTFTRKAALEMKERIFKRLIENASLLSDDIIETLPLSYISTIDSFASEIVRTDSVSYGLSRDFTIHSDDEEERMIKKLAYSFIEDEDNKKYVDILSKLFSPSDFIDDFFLRINKLSSFVSNMSKEVLFNRLKADLYERKKEEDKKLEQCISDIDPDDIPSPEREYFDEFVTSLQAGDLPTSYDFYNGRKKSYLNGVKDDLKGLRDYYKDIYLPFIDALHAIDENKELYEVVEKFYDRLKIEKRRVGALSFNDVLMLAIDILKRNKRIRSYYKSKFKYIMIDEFQDNNIHQRDLLFLLSERDDLYYENQVPPLEALDKTKLFFVGDEKQSIYRFRGADVSVFNALKSDIVKAGGKYLTLSYNFRSEKPLIDHYNAVFSSLLTTNGITYESTKTLKDRVDSSKVELYLLDKADCTNELEYHEVEANHIAALVYKILHTDEYLVDGKRVNLSDIAILMRSGTNQLNIEKALKHRGIIYQTAESKSLMFDALASDFYALLESIFYPDNKLSYYALLKSPFARLDDLSLERVASGEEFTDKAYLSFLTFYNSVKENLFKLSIPELLDYIYTASGYKAYIDINPELTQYSEHYELLYLYAVKAEERGESIVDYLKFLRKYCAKEIRLPEIELLRERVEGVQILSIHKAKGLEWKVVIFAGLGNKDVNEKKRVLSMYKNNLLIDSSKALSKLFNGDERALNREEVRRLLYVALTRSRNYLFLTSVIFYTKDGSVNGNCGELLKIYLDAIKFSPLEISSPLVEIKTIDCEESNIYSKQKSVDEKRLLEEFKNEDEKEFTYKPYRVKVTSLEEERLNASDKIALKESSVDEIIKRYSAYDKFGTLCHYVLELLMKDKPLTELTCSISKSENENISILKVAKEYAYSFLESPLYKKYIEGNRRDSEVRFYTYDDENDQVVEGVIDLVVFLDSYNLVVDYKSDYLKAPLEHKKQITTYVKIAKELYNKPCYGTLYYLRSGDEEEIWDEDGVSVKL